MFARFLERCLKGGSSSRKHCKPSFHKVYIIAEISWEPAELSVVSSRIYSRWHDINLLLILLPNTAPDVIRSDS